MQREEDNTDLLSFAKLLNGAINTLLEDSDLVILLLTNSVNLSLSVIKFDEKVVDLQLLSLAHRPQSVPTYQR